MGGPLQKNLSGFYDVQVMGRSASRAVLSRELPELRRPWVPGPGDVQKHLKVLRADSWPGALPVIPSAF